MVDIYTVSIIFSWFDSPVCPGLLFVEVLSTHSDTQHHIDTPGGIGNHDPSKRSVANAQLRLNHYMLVYLTVCFTESDVIKPNERHTSKLLACVYFYWLAGLRFVCLRQNMLY
jgi:hypothetical protein